MENRKDARKFAGYLEGWVSIAINTILFIAKFYYGVLFNSIAVVADSIHTLSDSLTSVVVILGFWIGYKPADEEHPFGHGRAELIATIVIGSMLVMVGIDFIQRSVNKLLSREGLIFSWILVAVLAISAIVKEALALWAIKLGKKYEAQSIIADAWHHRSDAIASALLAIAIVFSETLWWLDGVLGVVVSAIIIATAIKLVIETASEILGKAPSEEDLKKLEKIVYETSPLVKDVHHVHIHKYGAHIEVTLHVRLDPVMSLNMAHEIATQIEKNIREKLGWEATVHVEPVRKG